MEERKFKTGDIVRVEGLSNAPAMSIQHYATLTSQLDPAYRCVWFDNEHRLQDGVFHESTLIIKEEGHSFPASNFM